MKLVYQPPLIFCYKVYLVKDISLSSISNRFGYGSDRLIGHDTTKFRWYKGSDKNGKFVSFRLYDEAVEFMMWSG